MRLCFFLRHAADAVPIQRAAAGVRRPPTNGKRGAKRREFSTQRGRANGAAVRRFLLWTAALHSFNSDRTHVRQTIRLAWSGKFFSSRWILLSEKGNNARSQQHATSYPAWRESTTWPKANKNMISVLVKAGRPAL